MVKMLEMSGGHIIIRDASGNTKLDTRAPMPVKLGEDSLSCSFTWPNPSNVSVNVFANTATFSTNSGETTSQPCGTSSGTYAGYDADWMIVSLAMRRTNGNDFVGATVAPIYVACPKVSEWSPYMCSTGGSFLMEIGYDGNDPPWYFRHVNIRKSSSNWYADFHHAHGSKTVSYGSVNGGAAIGSQVLTYSYELTGSVMWGIFK